MKPSEYLEKINVDIIGDLSELDKKFIERERILPIVKKELQEGCKGTSANCYDIYQKIKKEVDND